ncbi:MAG: hypothetical protein WBM13_12080 [Bacteroidia bacterium]
MKTFIRLKFVFLVIVCVVGFANITKAQDNQQNTSKKYVRIDIGHEALHCPFLSPKLEKNLREVSVVSNFFIDKRSSYITFELPVDTDITEAYLKKIGTDVGYPAADVMVVFSNQPIPSSSAH